MKITVQLHHYGTWDNPQADLNEYLDKLDDLRSDGSGLPRFSICPSCHPWGSYLACS
jgi:hypothetical protein